MTTPTNDKAYLTVKCACCSIVIAKNKYFAHLYKYHIEEIMKNPKNIDKLHSKGASGLQHSLVSPVVLLLPNTKIPIYCCLGCMTCNDRSYLIDKHIVRNICKDDNCGKAHRKVVEQLLLQFPLPIITIAPAEPTKEEMATREKADKCFIATLLNVLSDRNHAIDKLLWSIMKYKDTNDVSYLDTILDDHDSDDLVADVENTDLENDAIDNNEYEELEKENDYISCKKLKWLRRREDLECVERHTSIPSVICIKSSKWLGVSPLSHNEYENVLASCNPRKKVVEPVG